MITVPSLINCFELNPSTKINVTISTSRRIENLIQVDRFVDGHWNYRVAEPLKKQHVFVKHTKTKVKRKDNQ